MQELAQMGAGVGEALSWPFQLAWSPQINASVRLAPHSASSPDPPYLSSLLCWPESKPCLSCVKRNSVPHCGKPTSGQVLGPFRKGETGCCSRPLSPICGFFHTHMCAMNLQSLAPTLFAFSLFPYLVRLDDGGG